MCACKQAYFCLQAHHVLYVVKQYPVHIVYINLCLSHAGGVSACLRLQANRLSRECCDLSLQSAGVSHNVALHHAPLQGGCHIGGDKSANMASLGLEIALCAASNLHINAQEMNWRCFTVTTHGLSVFFIVFSRRHQLMLCWQSRMLQFQRWWCEDEVFRTSVTFMGS